MSKEMWVDKEFSIEEMGEFVDMEHWRQLSKWGEQKRTPFEWMTYLTEEVGELAEAISENVYRGGSKKAVFKEAIQTATLALKIANMSRQD